MPAKASKSQKEKARACRESGCSLKEAGRQCGVSEMSVQRWEKAAELDGDPWRLPGRVPSQPPPVEGGPLELADAAGELQAAELAGTTLDVLRRMLVSTLRLARQAELAGNHSAAQRAGRDAGELAKVIARLEKAETADADVLRISRAEIAEGMVALEDRFRAITARPLLCADCGRKLAAEWGHSKPDSQDE